ncbi:MAG: TIGR04282 family arsenosugar biosynthesis glycosyltransferase [Hyphomicrobium sp.]
MTTVAPRNPFACRLVVMVKEPHAGRVKTRLARGMGAVAATGFYRHATAALLSRLGGEWTTLLAVSPDTARSSPAWPRTLARIGQGRGNLGQRMQRIMNRLPPGPVVIIGSDCPEVDAAHIRAAFRALGRHDAVVGPASDGGYWLIGLKRFPRTPDIFRDIRWSSEHALADTLGNLSGQGGRALRVALLATLDDVDEAADLARTRGTFGRRVKT